MISSQAVFDEVKRLLDFPEEDAEKITRICEFSAETLSKRLREKYTGEESEAVYAAAVIRFLKAVLTITATI